MTGWWHLIGVERRLQWAHMPQNGMVLVLWRVLAQLHAKARQDAAWVLQKVRGVQCVSGVSGGQQKVGRGMPCVRGGGGHRGLLGVLLVGSRHFVIPRG